MSIEGSIRDVGLADICQLLSLGRKTGCLTISHLGNFGYVYFQNGRVIHATVLNRPDRLGDVLVKHGAITEDQLQAAVEAQRSTPRTRLGQILVEEGALTQEELTRFITVQIEEAVYNLFTWTEGSFQFESGARPDEEDQLLVSLNADGLLMEGARRVDEWSVIEKKITSMDLVFELDRDPREDEEAVDLTPVQEILIPLIDGERTVLDLVDDTGRVEFQVAKAVYGLVQAGFARAVGERARPQELELPSGAGQADQRINVADAYTRAGMVEEAVAELQAVLDVDPRSPEALHRLALVHLKGGRFARAIEVLDQLGPGDAESRPALRNRAVALEKLGRFDEALAALDQAEERHGEDPGLLLARGIVELKSRNPGAAWSTLQRYRIRLGRDRTPPPIFYSFAVLAAAMAGDASRAVSVGQEGLKAHSDDPAILVNLGAALERQGQWEAAEALFIRAAAQVPASPQAHKNLGDLAYRRGDLPGARAHFERAIKLSPNLGDDVYLKLGNLAYREGDADWASLLWGKALDLNPRNQVVQRNLDLLESESAG